MKNQEKCIKQIMFIPDYFQEFRLVATTGIIPMKKIRGMSILTWVVKHYPENTDLIISILNTGINVNIRDNVKKTPLIHYVYHCNPQPSTIKMLLVRGADINAQDVYGKTCLMYACINRNAKIVKLLSGFNPDLQLKDNHKRSCIDYINSLEKSSISILWNSAGVISRSSISSVGSCLKKE